MQQPDTARADAATLLLALVERTLNPAEHADIEAWIERREEDEGGFLWLVGVLSIRPSVMELSLRTMLTSSPRERQRLRQQLFKGRNGNGNGHGSVA